MRTRHHARPAIDFGLHVGDGDGLAGGVAVHTWAFVGLELEEFDFASLLGGDGQQAELLEWVCQ
jgi:hypothetical protein